MNIGELFKEYWAAAGRYNNRIENPQRFYSSLQKKCDGFNELEEIDQYVSALKTRKESTRMIMVDFFQFLSNKKGIEYCSCLENQRFFDYPFERQLAIAKFLHKKEHRKRLKQNSAFQEERFLKIC